MPHDFTLRWAEPQDVDTILRLITELAEYERLAHEVVATKEGLKRWLFDEPQAECIIANREGRDVGFAIFFTNFSTFLAKPGIYLEDLFVEPSSRGKGIGKALMRRIAQITIERGYARFDWAVLDWNEPSIEFYRSLGAVPMDTWTVQRLTGEALAQFASTEQPIKAESAS